MTLSVLGCGWLGTPLAAFCAAQGHNVRGSTTSPEKLSHLKEQNIIPFLIDLSAADVKELEAFCASDCLIIMLPPKGDSTAYIDAIRRILVHTPETSDVILISSTGVYPDLGTRIDESTPVTETTTPRPHLLEAETIIRRFTSRHLILRCAGLMGYGRMGASFFQNRPVAMADTPVNQVHRDDVIRALFRLIEKKCYGVYNLCSPLHPTKRELYTHQAERLGLPLPRFEAGEGAFKIVEGDKVCLDTGYAYRYPDPMAFV